MAGDLLKKTDHNPNVSAEAQEEYDNLFAPPKPANHHPEDSDDDKLFEELDEEAEYIQKGIQDTMRMPTLDGAATYHLPNKNFDFGKNTGIKGVIADYRNSRRKGKTEKDDEPEPEVDEDIVKLRELRLRDLKKKDNDIRNRRKYEEYGNFDIVDAIGLDGALTAVAPDTVVLVFIYDPESELSNWFEEALEPLVSEYPRVHFVKIYRQDIDFEPAGVPAIVAYRKDQGEKPIANLTPLEDYMPDEVELDTDVMKNILQRHHIL